MGPLTIVQPLVPFMKWEIDFMGPLKNTGRFKYIIAATNYVTKSVEAKVLTKNFANLLVPSKFGPFFRVT